MSKLLIAVCAFVVSSLQAWDSHVLEAEIGVQVLVLAGVLLPALTILGTRDTRIRGGAVLMAAVVMVACRVISAQPMPGLALAAFFPGMLILVDHIKFLADRDRAKSVPLVDHGRSR